MRFIFHTEARIEFLEAVRHYESREPHLGERFASRAREAIDKIVEAPAMADSGRGNQAALDKSLSLCRALFCGDQPYSDHCRHALPSKTWLLADAALSVIIFQI